MNKLLRLPKVIDRTGLSKSTIYSFILAGTFPKPISLGERAVAWQESDISEWIEKRIAASKAAPKGVAQ
jgi:prophage regulatory protein